MLKNVKSALKPWVQCPLTKVYLYSALFLTVPICRHFLLNVPGGKSFYCIGLYQYLHRHRRHRDKHIRPYICTNLSCAGKNFGDKGGLDRHRREVHGTETYTCPITSCPRNKHGFGRKYNLLLHQNRRHRLQTPSLHRARSNTSGDIVERSTAIEGDVNSNQALQSKLRNLQVLRARLDKDIVSLQGGSPSIMGRTFQ